MTAGYLAWDEARLDGEWQGIRRLALEIHPTTPPSATITVHLAQDTSGLRRAAVAVDGPRPLEITAMMFDPGAPTITIKLATIGSRATHWVRLLEDRAHPLHPMFAMASFQFAIDCESADCRPSPFAAPRAEGAAPPIDYATRDYQGFQTLLSTHVRVRHDDWGDPAAASQEQLLLDLLAHHGDMLAYFQDRVANEAFVATARTRHALHQHALLLGHEVNDGIAGTTILAFEVGNPGWIPSGVAVRTQTREGDEPIHYTTRARTPARPEHGPRRSSGPGQLALAAWPGAAAARLPAGTTRVLLWGHDLGLRVGQRLALWTARATFVVRLVDVAEISLPGWTVSPADLPPTTPVPVPVTQITWDARDALPRDLEPWRADAPAGSPHVLVFGNLVDAVFGEPREAATEPLDPRVVAIDRSPRAVTIEGDATNRGIRALRIPEAPIVWDSGAQGRVPAIEVEIADAAGVLQPWHRQAHLHSSRPFDRHYAFAPADGGVAWLLFGDGERGAVVPEAARIVVRYRSGRTAGGNCPRGVLEVIDPPLAEATAGELERVSVIGVRNVVDGAGSIAAESNDAARESIPASLRHGRPQRAVALADYARAAREVAGVARATARALSGVFNTVLVLVDPEGQAELSPELSDAVWRHLERVRMAGREHVVSEARYVPLEVELWVCAEPGVPRHRVRERVLSALRPGGNDNPGWFHPDRLSFAESIELGEVLAVVQQLPGVRSVKARRFRRLLVATDNLVEARLVMQPIEVARLDADLARPDNGRLEVKVVGLGGINESEYDVAIAGGAS